VIDAELVEQCQHHVGEGRAIGSPQVEVPLVLAVRAAGDHARCKWRIKTLKNADCAVGLEGQDCGAVGRWPFLVTFGESDLRKRSPHTHYRRCKAAKQRILGSEALDRTMD